MDDEGLKKKTTKETNKTAQQTQCCGNQHLGVEQRGPNIQDVPELLPACSLASLVENAKAL